MQGLQKVGQGYKLIRYEFNKEIAVPEDWSLSKLSEVCDILDAQRIPIEESERRRRKGNIPYYGASGIIDYIDDFIFDERLLCLAEDGENLRSRVLPVAFIIEGKTWVNNHAHVLKPKENAVDIRHLDYFLNHRKYEKYLSFTAQPKLTQEEMKKIMVLLPPLIEQQKIASILSSVGELIQKTDQIVEQTQRLKKGLMQRLFSVGIGHTEFKNIPYEFHKEIKLPITWTVSRLSELCEILDSQRIPLEESQRRRRRGSIPYYGASGIIDYIDDFIFNEKLLCLAEDGENLRSRVLPVAFTIEGKSWVNNHAHVLRPKGNVNHEYLEHFLNHINYEKYLSFTAQPKLTQEEMKKILVIFPPLDEQKKITSIIDKIHQYIHMQQNYRDALDRLKKGLMQRLLTGKLRVKV